MGLEKVAKIAGDIGGIASGLGSVGSLVSGLGSLFGAGTSQEDLMKMQMENQLKLMEQANNYAVAQWNRENEYNSPFNQMRRLKEAGLNPLFHNLDGNSAGGLSSVSSPSAPDAGSIMNAVTNSMKSKFDMAVQAKQLESLSADVDLKRAEAELARANAKGKGIQNQRDNIMLGYDLEQQKFNNLRVFARDEDGNIMYDDSGNPIAETVYNRKLRRDLDAIDQTVKENARRIESIGYDNFKKQIENKYFEQNALMDLEKKGYDVETARLAIKYSIARISLTAAQTDKEKAAAKAELASAEEAISKAYLNYAEADTQEYIQDTEVARKENIEADTENKRSENDLIQKNAGRVEAETESQNIQNKREKDLYWWKNVVSCFEDATNIVYGVFDIHRLVTGTKATKSNAESNARNATTNEQRLEHDKQREENRKNGSRRSGSNWNR